MKKAFILLFLFFLTENTIGQTVLNRFPIELQKSSEFFQISNAANANKEYFTFISDKEKLTVLKYNSALFFADSISIPRPERKFEFIAGVTFDAAGEPNVFWSTSNYETLRMIHFDFKNRTTSDLIYTNNFARKKIIDVIVAENRFTILSITPENTLKFTTFSNVGKADTILSLDALKPETSALKTDTLINAILDQGLTVIHPKQFTPLYIGTAKTKRYLIENQYIISFDLENETALLTVDLRDFSAKINTFPYEKTAVESGSNSFMHEQTLYQIAINNQELVLTGTSIGTKNRIGKFSVDAKKEIDFKNSPLLLQSENGKVREFKNTAKFLQKINPDQVGLSIYATPHYNLFTIGGVREVASGSDLALGLGLGIGGILAGSDIFLGNDYMTSNTQSLYFESFFDTDFKQVKEPFRPLYIDALGDFLSVNRPVVQNLFVYQDYLILNYYDIKTKAFVMRKFEDIRD